MRWLLPALAMTFTLTSALPASAQDLVRGCLPVNDQGNGLSVQVGTDGVVHLARIARVARALLYTRIGADGVATTEIAATEISRLITAEVEDTGMLVEGDTVNICVFDAQRKRMVLAARSAGVWTLTTIAQNVEGGGCDLTRYRGRLTLAYENNGVLRVATEDAGTWSIVTADSLAGHRVGVRPALAVGPSDALAIAHRDATDGVLRVSWISLGAWRSAVPTPMAGLSAGVQAAAWYDDQGTLRIQHGVASARPDLESDLFLMRTFGAPGAAMTTQRTNEANVGGTVGAARAGGVSYTITRLLSRSALFGNDDGLLLYTDQAAEGVFLERNGANGQRHTYKFTRIAIDPFGLPVVVFLDEVSAFFGEPAGAPTCYWRPRDSDGDAIPDAREADYGTRVDDPDTDGDGRTDGEEVLIDGTDPLTAAACTPAAETCNGRDDDCDTRVDESLSRNCYPGPAGTQDVGTCRGGTQTCAAGAYGVCQGTVVPVDEVCNGLDDDCDRVVDDGNPGSGGVCNTGGVGACGEGVVQCRAGALQCDPVAAADVEQCNGADDDCDGLTDEGRTSCGVGACARTVDTCANGRPQICSPGQPAFVDEDCDGVDDDCDGLIDEDYPVLPTQCGLGVCARNGQRRCVAGHAVDTCVPGAAAPSDATCDNVDEDCDGRFDENFAAFASSCGIGACAAQGQVTCAFGRTQNDCVPGPAGANDATCDGVDEDCDGAFDENAGVTATQCGAGVCASNGQRVCRNGAFVNTCVPRAGLPNDVTCDGVDDDCDGRVDEDYVAVAVSCGAGVCAAQGATRCVNGRVLEDCNPGPSTGADTVCDGLDTDCDGRTDESFASQITQCGAGACVASGRTRCANATVEDTCVPPVAGGSDAACNGVDDDCDGRTDEAFVPQATTCGVGACAAQGLSSCQAGGLRDTCVVGPSSGTDNDCDGIDDDCDGRVDEAFLAQPTTCGVGTCAGAGTRRCVGGQQVDTCRPGTPQDADLACDGRDTDCDGRVDEGYRARATTCGLGVCAAVGQTTCVGGGEGDTCAPRAAPEPGDRTCDGDDGDCDGSVDEGFVAQATSCGEGACRGAGVLSCVDGVQSDSCRAGTGSVADRTCDGVDDDCDGRVDENFRVRANQCGVGVCAAVGQLSCEDGHPVNTCAALPQAGPDSTCDGRDDDCDGRVDEAYAVSVTVCGLGACAGAGQRVCVIGVERDTCVPSDQIGVDDPTCDGTDDDCDGNVDEDFVEGDTACGAGVCAATGRRVCAAGGAADSCAPGPTTGDDEDCDGLDDDCDGSVDEGYVPQNTTCGAGVCAAQGQTACNGGVVSDGCVAGPSTDGDVGCDGLDGDCDGRVDEAFAVVATHCGLGECASSGQRQCRNGRLRDTCRAGNPAPDDLACDGIDEDCDGSTDEGFVSQATICGVGACAAQGQTECAAGAVRDTCQPGAGAADDARCDGQDQDCDGRTDEDYVGGATACGQGVCAGTGERGCELGVEVDSCRLAPRQGDDDDCDALDDDCDGRVDEAYASRPTACGVGACAAEGFTRCVAGGEMDTCRPRGAEGGDATCDGVDDDCDGNTDEDFTVTVTTCGRGECEREGLRRCLLGDLVDTCLAARPGPDDTACDGLDSDCDGRTDEAFETQVTTCGVGACAGNGLSRCVEGAVADSCAAGAPGDDDGTCDLTDDDCDGLLDESFVVTRSTCGTGACAAGGRVLCINGELNDTCREFSGAPDDLTCNGFDDDCDGVADEDFTVVPTTCGLGTCASAGMLACLEGVVLDTCGPLEVLGDDDTCDGQDDDCDGFTDEAYAGEVIGCGVGACATSVLTACFDGAPTGVCEPGAAGARDFDCDGVDADCDGQADEDAPVTPTTCGAGACAREGELRCQGGHFVDGCEEGFPEGDDDTCDGVDDDCDDVVDEFCRADAGTPAPDAALPTDDAAVDAAIKPEDGGPTADAALVGDGGGDAALPTEGDASGTPDEGASGEDDATSDPRTDAGDRDGGAADAGGDGQVSTDDVSGSGCDCDATDRSASPALWALLALLGLVRRRGR